MSFLFPTMTSSHTFSSLLHQPLVAPLALGEVAVLPAEKQGPKGCVLIALLWPLSQ